MDHRNRARLFFHCSVLRTSVIAEHWLIADRQYDEFVHALDVLPAGGRYLQCNPKERFL